MKTYTYLSFVSLGFSLITSFFLSPSVSMAAGGGDANAGIGNASNINNPGSVNNNGSNGLPSSSGFSFSQQFQGYGSGISSCGTQAFVNTGLANGGNTSGNIVGTNYTITGGFIFNEQRCIDPNKQLQVQSEQTNAQKSINCVQERSKNLFDIF